MLSDAHLQKIAQILKSNGSDGELILGFREVGLEDINISEPVFIYFDGLPVPYFIESVFRRGAFKAVVRLTGIRSAKDAEEVVGKSVYAECGSIDTDRNFGDMLLDWIITDKDGNRFGTVSDYHEFPGNPCLEVIKADGGESVLVPFHEDLVISVDEMHSIIQMDIPEGL